MKSMNMRRRPTVMLAPKGASKHEQGTWLEPEELAYSTPRGKASGSKRRAYAMCSDGQRRTFRVGVADTFFSIPAVGKRNFQHVKGYVSLEEGVLVFTETTQ